MMKLFFTALIFWHIALVPGFPLYEGLAAVPRRTAILSLAGCFVPLRARAVQDRLTPQEMEEYKRLLIEAERIINVTEAMKSSALDGIMPLTNRTN